MKKIFFIISSLMIASVSFCQTQAEMNADAKKQFEKTDKELNEVYQKILVKYKDDTLFIKNLKIAQRAWVEFRDAQMNMKFPEREEGYYGSVLPMCWSLYEKELTDNRIKELRIWVDGIEEGDVCAGSVIIKQ